MMPPKIHLFADVLTGFGGIETYLQALARTLLCEGRAFSIAASPTAPTPFLDELESNGVDVYRQPRIPGDRFFLRQRLLVAHLARKLGPGDWVYCVRQPLPQLYPVLVRTAHRRGAQVAASWMLAPEFLPPPAGERGRSLCKAIAETDVVISVSKCTADQFSRIYGYDGPVHIVRYHNEVLFQSPVALPAGPPFRLAFLGRVEIVQKNLDSILMALQILSRSRQDFEFHVYGGGPDISKVATLAQQLGVGNITHLHGHYDRAADLSRIVAANHVFLYTSRYEGGPCLSLLELMQGGRFVIASPTGGIPDIYAGRPDAGLLAAAEDPVGIAATIDASLTMIARGEIKPEAIRARYDEEFDNVTAHQQWLSALQLPRTRFPRARADVGGQTS